LVDLSLDIKTIGLFSLIALPYSLKFLWAPFLDSISIPFLTKKLGKRRSWILLNQILLVVFIAVLGLAGQSADIKIIALVSFAIAVVSATQDMAVDAYRIEKVKPEDQAIAASFYVYGYRIGMLISGAGALILSDTLSWDKVFYLMSLFMIIGIATTLFAKENIATPTPKKNFITWFKTSVLDPFIDFAKRPKWYVILLFVIAFKLCDSFAGSLILPFLLEIGFSKTQIAAIVKTFGLFATLFGALAGGILVKKIGLMKSLWIAAILQMLSNLAFCYQAFLGHNINALYVIIFIENFSGGIGDAVFVAYLSSLCNVAFTATQYALLASFASMSRSFLSSSAGFVVASVGWIWFFALSSLLALPALIFLFWLQRIKTPQTISTKPS
jgi:PAT family beta-lactamase induction signal transducer AmpG